MLLANMFSSPLNILAFVCGTIGAICIALFSYPALIRLIKTKDSTSISITMFAILSTGSFFFVLNGIFGMINDSGSVPSLIGVTIANTLSFISAISTLTIKLMNIYKAKKRNISEKQWCESLIKKGGKNAK